MAALRPAHAFFAFNLPVFLFCQVDRLEVWLYYWKQNAISHQRNILRWKSGTTWPMATSPWNSRAIVILAIHFLDTTTALADTSRNSTSSCPISSPYISGHFSLCSRTSFRSAAAESVFERATNSKRFLVSTVYWWIDWMAPISVEVRELLIFTNPWSSASNPMTLVGSVFAASQYTIDINRLALTTPFCFFPYKMGVIARWDCVWRTALLHWCFLGDKKMSWYDQWI